MYGQSPVQKTAIQSCLPYLYSVDADADGQCGKPNAPSQEQGRVRFWSTTPLPCLTIIKKPDKTDAY